MHHDGVDGKRQAVSPYSVAMSHALCVRFPLYSSINFFSVLLNIDALNELAHSHFLNRRMFQYGIQFLDSLFERSKITAKNGLAGLDAASSLSAESCSDESCAISELCRSTWSLSRIRSISSSSALPVPVHRPILLFIYRYDYLSLCCNNVTYGTIILSEFPL